MFMCMMQAKRGTAHRESMYDLQHQGQEEDATSCELCGYKNSTDGCPNDQPSRGVWGSAQAAGNSAASARGQRREDRCAAGDLLITTLYIIIICISSFSVKKHFAGNVWNIGII